MHTLRDQLGRAPRGRYRSAMMILRTMRLPEEIQRSSLPLPTTSLVPLLTVPMQLSSPLYISDWISGFLRLRSKLCMVPSPLAATRWCLSIFKNEETYPSNLLKVITLVSPSLLSHILTNPSSSPVTEMLMSKLAQLYKGESWHFRYLCLRKIELKKL